MKTSRREGLTIRACYIVGTCQSATFELKYIPIPHTATVDIVVHQSKNTVLFHEVGFNGRSPDSLDKRHYAGPSWRRPQVTWIQFVIQGGGGDEGDILYCRYS